MIPDYCEHFKPVFRNLHFGATQFSRNGVNAVFAIMNAVFAGGCEEDLEIPLGVYTATEEGYLTMSGGKKGKTIGS